MLDILHFIFSGFWIWVGTVFLVFALGWAIATVLLAARGESE